MALNFYGADGSNGQVAVNNGATSVVGTGTQWLTNVAVPTGGGYCIKMPDGQIYGIESCSGDGALTLCENYRGTNISGGSYYIIPVEEATVRLIEQVSTLLNSGTFAQLAGLAGSSGAFIQYIADTWAVRTPLQALSYLFNSMAEVDIASASTTNIGTATSPKVQITGTTAITSLGNTINAVRLVRFGGALTLTHNATSLVLPCNGANITTASGDTALFASDASGNWRCLDYQRADGRMVNMAAPVFSGNVIGQSFSGTGAAGTSVAIYGSASDVTSKGIIVQDGRLLVGQAAGADRTEPTSQFSILGAAYTAYHWMDANAYYIGQNSNARSIRMYSGSNTAVGVQLSPGGTSLGTYSDYRAKNVYGPFQGAAQIVDTIAVHDAELKARLGVRRAMFLAHEVQPVLPNLVRGEKDAVNEEGEDVLQVLDSSDPMVPILWAALQETRADNVALRALVDALSVRVTALEAGSA